MSPDDKGFAISNMAELAQAHNSYSTESINVESETTISKPAAPMNSNLRASQRILPTSGEAFHFISFLPIDGHLMELDGLKQYPIDHGPIDPNEPWTEMFRKLIKKRIEMSEYCSEIRYNLMAVIPNKYQSRSRWLRLMERNRINLLKILHFMEFYSSFSNRFEHNYSKFKSIDQEYTDHERDVSTDGSFIPFNHHHTRIESKNASIVFEDEYSRLQINESDHDSESTVTASEVGSDQEFVDEENQIANEHNNSLGSKCYKYFICKFTSTRLKGPSLDFADNNLEPSYVINDLIDNLITKIEIKHSIENNSGKNDVLGACLVQKKKIRSAEKQTISLANHSAKINSKIVSKKCLDRKKMIKLLLEKMESFRDRILRKDEFNFELQPMILRDLTRLVALLSKQISICQYEFDFERSKIKRYELDASRRTHNYDELIESFLLMLTEKGVFDEIFEKKRNLKFLSKRNSHRNKMKNLKQTRFRERRNLKQKPIASKTNIESSDSINVIEKCDTNPIVVDLNNSIDLNEEEISAKCSDVSFESDSNEDCDNNDDDDDDEYDEEFIRTKFDDDRMEIIDDQLGMENDDDEEDTTENTSSHDSCYHQKVFCNEECQDDYDDRSQSKLQDQILLNNYERENCFENKIEDDYIEKIDSIDQTSLSPTDHKSQDFTFVNNDFN